MVASALRAGIITDTHGEQAVDASLEEMADGPVMDVSESACKVVEAIGDGS